MEIFLSSPILAVFLIIIGLYLYLTKHSFGGSKVRKYKQDTVKIIDGKVIYCEQLKDEPSVKNTNAIQQSASQKIEKQQVDEPAKKHVQKAESTQEEPDKQALRRIINDECEELKAQVEVTNKEIEEGIKNRQATEDTDVAAENTEDKPKSKAGRLPSVNKFWDYLDVGGRGKRTIQEYKYEWNWWTKEAKEKGKTVYTLKVADIEAILKGKDPSTTRRKIAFLRTLSKWYLREGYPRLHEEAWKLTVPKLPKRIPKDKGQEKFEELREKAKQMVAEKNRVGLWIALKLLCGLRISEIQTARVASEEAIQVLGKGNKERLIPAPEWVIAGMKKIKQDGKEGWRQDRFVIWYYLSKIELKNPHSLRHTCASELLRKGLKIEEIKEFLGHENIATTSIYARAVVPTHASKLLDS